MKSIWESMFGAVTMGDTSPGFDVNIEDLFHAKVSVDNEFVVGEFPWITFRHPLDNSFTENFPNVNTELVIKGEEK